MSKKNSRGCFEFFLNGQENLGEVLKNFTQMGVELQPLTPEYAPA